MVEQYITWLITHGFHPDMLEEKGFNGNTPLLLAALEGNAMMVSRLIEAGANLYAMLVDAGADINDSNEEGTTALMYAASASRGACVKMLLSLGANPHMVNDDGFRAIELTSDRDVFRQLRSA